MICPYFYFQYGQLICRCIHKESNCMAISEKCENKLAKKSYEEDMQDTKRKEKKNEYKK